MEEAEEPEHRIVRSFRLINNAFIALDTEMTGLCTKDTIKLLLRMFDLDGGRAGCVLVAAS